MWINVADVILPTWNRKCLEHDFCCPQLRQHLIRRLGIWYHKKQVCQGEKLRFAREDIRSSWHRSISDWESDGYKSTENWKGNNWILCQERKMHRIQRRSCQRPLQQLFLLAGQAHELHHCPCWRSRARCWFGNPCRTKTGNWVTWYFRVWVLLIQQHRAILYQLHQWISAVAIYSRCV